MFQGSCLCRGVRYELSAEPGAFGYCHCTSCRKASGSGYESSAGKFRAFCTNCGSPLYAYLSTLPEVIRIRLGTLDTPFLKQPQAHTWVSDKAPWKPIDDAIPQFATWAPKSILDQRGTRQG